MSAGRATGMVRLLLFPRSNFYVDQEKGNILLAPARSSLKMISTGLNQ